MRRSAGARATVVVQGELAQSPRMLNHVRALLANGWFVTLVGYGALALPNDLAAHPSLRALVTTHFGTARWPRMPQPLYLASAALRAMWTGLRLAETLLVRVRETDLFLVQNPPAFPALLVTSLAAARARARLVIDWHNLTFSVLAIRLGFRHPLVRAIEFAEGHVARRAAAHLCVSAAMRADLHRRWGLDAAVVRDRPLAEIPRLNGESRRIALRQLGELLRLSRPISPASVIAISPSSWSIDEDMEMLLDAFAIYAKRSGSASVTLIATGEGPGRAAFEHRARSIASERLTIVTGWLPEAPYRDLLSVADVGICMHRSSSRLDIPMKLADLRSAGVPALLYDYGPAWHEVLEPARAAGTFFDANGLADRLTSLLADAPEFQQLDSLRADVRANILWNEEWTRNALPVLMSSVERRGPRVYAP